MYSYWCLLIHQQIIAASIRHAYREKQKNYYNDSEVAPSLTLSGIHLAYSQIQRRINLCTQAIQTWPDVVSKLQSARDKQDIALFRTDTEMVICVIPLAVRTMIVPKFSLLQPACSIAGSYLQDMCVCIVFFSSTCLLLLDN